jgi:riboflavin kinase/FMN adenylyltransferase
MFCSNGETMKVFRGLIPMADQGRVVTLGVFDGVHRGHVKILQACCCQARRLGIPAAVITFSEHPHSTLLPQKRPPRLATPEQCLNRMQQLCMDEVFLVRFTKTLANTQAEDFVQKILLQRLQARHIVVGRDFVFGKNGKGGISLLRYLGRKHGFGVSVVNPLRYKREVVSSSGLRTLVAQGKVELARAWLGWPYALHGIVVSGEGRGSRIGLPTANLKTNHEIVPQPGTYAVVAYLENIAWPALCNIGKRPTFHIWGPETIEVHIPGWDGTLHRKQLIIGFLSRLRSERRFTHVDALLRQVQHDYIQTKRVRKKIAKQEVQPDFISCHNISEN